MCAVTLFARAAATCVLMTSGGYVVASFEFEKLTGPVTVIYRLECDHWRDVMETRAYRSPADVPNEDQDNIFLPA